MENLIEGVLELLFGRTNHKPDKMPEIKYTDNFVVKNNTGKIAMQVIASLVFTVVFAILYHFVDKDTQILYLIFIILILFILFFSVSALFYRCKVTPEKISQKIIFEKTVYWKDIICVRKCETTNDKNVIIALYNSDGKCVFDVSSEMHNAWYIVKMAEHKNIEIREEKDLSLKQIKRL